MVIPVFDFVERNFNERLNLQPIKLNSATADRIPGFPLIGCKFKSLLVIYIYNRFN